MKIYTLSSLIVVHLTIITCVNSGKLLSFKSLIALFTVQDVKSERATNLKNPNIYCSLFLDSISPKVDKNKKANLFLEFVVN